MTTPKSGPNPLDGHEVARTANGREHENVLRPKFYIVVEDEFGKPLFDPRSATDARYVVRYRIHQTADQKKDEGTLDEQGRAFFEVCDPKKPFRFEVEGRVCAITAGATFLLEQLDKSIADGGIEYGGTFFDWSWADDDGLAPSTDGKRLTKSEIFWHEYGRVREGSMKYEIAAAGAKVSESEQRNRTGRDAIIETQRKHDEATRKLERAKQRYDSAGMRINARDRATSTEYATLEKEHKAARQEEEAAAKALDAAIASGMGSAEQRIDRLNEAEETKKAAAKFAEAQRHGGPTTFWQHEHITRRDIRIRKKYLDQFPRLIVVIRAQPVQIRVGPLVRFTTHDAAAIWIELETPGMVRVKSHPPDVYAMRNKSDFSPRYGTTVRVGGRYFALVLIDGLKPNHVHPYSVELAPLPAVGKIPLETNEFTNDVFPTELPVPVMQNIASQVTVCSFLHTKWLSFRTLRQKYDKDLRFTYGSCRSTRGDGPDAMARLGAVLGVTDREEWPHFALFIGDQIYADQLRDDLGFATAAQRFASRLPGPTAQENGNSPAKTGAWGGRLGERFVDIKQLKAQITKDTAQRERQRELLERVRQGGPGKQEAMREVMRMPRLTSHSYSAMEHLPANFYADHQVLTPMRFNYSINNHLLWEIPVEPADVPRVDESSMRKQHGSTPDQLHQHPAGDTAIHAADFAEYAFMHEDAWAGDTADQRHVRRVLAHVPTFMIFDDHEACDDWNFSREWVDMIQSSTDPKHHWPTAIRDALAAYWMYQGWGNIDPRKSAEDKRVKILAKARKDGSDALAELRRLLDPEVIPPTTEGERGRLEWYYKVPTGDSPRLLVLDGRTQRVLKAKEADSVVMTDNQWKFLEDELFAADRDRQAAVFVVAADPVLLPSALGLGMRAGRMTHEPASTKEGWAQGAAGKLVTKDQRRGRDMEHWVSDYSWNRIGALFEKLASRARHLRAVVFLSGDVHFNYNMVGSLPWEGKPKFPHLVQMCCSPIKSRLEAARVYKLRMLAEPSDLALSGLTEKPDKTMFEFLRWLSRPESAESEFDGMYTLLAGLNGGANPSRAILIENAVAFVDALFPAAGQLRLSERYLLADESSGKPEKALSTAPEFVYEVVEDPDQSLRDSPEPLMHVGATQVKMK